MRNPERLGLYMVLPRFTSPFRCMRSRFAKPLSYPFGTQLSFQQACWTYLAFREQWRNFYTLSCISFINKHLETVSSNVRCMTHRNETIQINDLCLSVGFRSDDVTPLIHLIKEGFFIRIHVHTGHKEIFGVSWHMV